jgi:predicted amidohydrolase
MSNMPLIRVAGVQMDVRLGDVAYNRTAMVHYLRETTATGAGLTVFPECALTGYGFASKDDAMPFAEPIPGPSTRLLADDCAWLKSYAIFGMLERDGDRLFNTAVLVGPEGVVGSYRKVHLPYLGVDRFTTPGDRPFAVHEVKGVRVGMLICYDGSFPEATRVLALLGADILVLPTNWPTHSECAAEHMMACRAMENTIYTMAVNRVGDESGFRFIGRSSIHAPNGEPIAFAAPDGEQVLYADIDPERSRRKHLVRVPGLHEINRVADRRPAFYGEIVKPNGRD